MEARYVELQAKCAGLEAQLRERGPLSLPRLLTKNSARAVAGLSGLLRQLFQPEPGARRTNKQRATIIAKEVKRLRALTGTGPRVAPSGTTPLVTDPVVREPALRQTSSRTSS